MSPAHPRGKLGSYSTGRLGIRFEGADLEKVEEGGWIFATNGKAFAGVKFLDGGHRRDEKRVAVNPASFSGPGDANRILLHAGDLTTLASFEHVRDTLRFNPLRVTPNMMGYRFGAGAQYIGMSRCDPAPPKTFALPRVNDTPVDLRPASTYQSPFLNGTFGDDRIKVSVGPVTRVLDFSEQGQCSPTTPSP